MPDITMCHGTGCPWKEHCYRHTAKPGDWQSYFAGVPGGHVAGKGWVCERYLIDVKKDLTTQEVEALKHRHTETSAEDLRHRQPVPVDLVWMATYQKPKGLENWEYYRIEYGGHAMDCVYEGSIFLPPGLNPDAIEELFKSAQGELHD